MRPPGVAECIGILLIFFAVQDIFGVEHIDHSGIALGYLMLKEIVVAGEFRRVVSAYGLVEIGRAGARHAGHVQNAVVAFVPKYGLVGGSHLQRGLILHRRCEVLGVDIALADGVEIGQGDYRQ